MAHNWTTKTVTDYPEATSRFVVVTGDDMLGDGGLDSPWRSINQAGINATIHYYSPALVLGTGTYTGLHNTNYIRKIVGEFGKNKQTIINMDGSSFVRGASVYLNWVFEDLTIKNGNIRWFYLLNNTFVAKRVVFIDCNIDNTYTLNDVSEMEFTDCDFINCTMGSENYIGKYKFVRCKFFNSLVTNNKTIYAGLGATVLESSYVDSFSRIEFAAEAAISEINYNDIEGQLKFQDGTNPDVYIGLAQALVEHPTKVGVNNINANPLFADVSKMAFTVSNSSPLLGASKMSGNIGNVKRGDVYFCDIDPELTDVSLGGNAEIINLDGTTDKTVNIAFPDGTFRTGVITVDSSNVSILGAIGYIGKYALDSSLGGSNNSQVPDSFDYADGTAGDNPDNLTFQMRWATGSTPPTTTTGWDNGGIRPADAYSTFVWNIQPRMDGAFLGNGDPAFNSGSSFVLGVKWIQIFGKIVKETWNGV